MGYFGQIIPYIYVALDDRKDDHYTYIIEIEGNLCDPFSYILIDPRSNYNYISLNLVDKCG